MSNLSAKRLHMRLFLEGIEAPVISAMIQVSINSPAVASISIVPTDEAHDLKVRTMVHLFFYDFTYDSHVDLDDFTKYKLLFAGEFIGFGESTAQMGRQTVLQCADFSSNWSKAYQYMITYGPDGNFITPTAANYAAGTSEFNNITDGHLQVLGRYISGTPRTPGLQGTKGLLGGIIHLIEQFGGVTGHTRGVSDYFTIAELKNKTMQQIAAEENDNTAQEIFQAKEFYEWLESGISQLGELCTLQDMVKLLFKYIYYEYVPNPSAYYVPGNPQKNQDISSERISILIQDVMDQLRNDKDGIAIRYRCLDQIEELKTLLISPSISKSQIEAINKAMPYIESCTVTDKYSKTMGKNLSSAIAALKAGVISSKPVKQNDVKLDRLNSLIFRPECYFVAPPRCNVIFPEHTTNLSYNRNMDEEYTRLRLQSGMMFDLDKEKLFADFSYAPSGKEIEEIAKEQDATKRLGAVLPWEKFSGVLPKFEYIQNINYVANKQQRALNKNILGFAKSYKQRAANFNFFKYRFMARTLNVSTRLNPFLVCGFPVLVIKKPFFVDKNKLIAIAKDRGTDLNKITDDNIVENIKEFSELLGAPLQYLAMPQTLTHMIDQNGATTSFSATHARSHRITNDDFLQIYKPTAEAGAGIETIKTYLDTDDLIAKGDNKKLQFLVDLTSQDPPQKNIITPTIAERPKTKVAGTDVLNTSFRTTNSTDLSYEAITSTVGNYSLVDVDGNTIKTPTSYGKINIGSNGLNGGKVSLIRILNEIITTVTINGKQQKAWKTVLVYEDRPSKKIIKPIPIEEILRPSWFNSLYSNLKIGENVYSKFFGTGSVVDQIVFSNPDGLSIQGAGADRNKILDSLATSKTPLEDVTALSQKDLFNIPSIETAANILAFQYGEAIQKNLDINRFISDYTYRPIATLVDILGSRDLEYKQDGDKLKITSGVGGFHSASIANFGNLLGIVDNPEQELPNRLGKGKISKTLDPRPERRAAVSNYVNKLLGDGGEIIGLVG